MSRLYQYLQQHQAQTPQVEAVVEGETRWTYAQYLAQVDRLAAALAAQGIAKGDRVGLMLYNQKEFLVAFFALRKLGAVITPINIQMLPQDIAFVVQNSGMKLVIIDQSLYAHLQHVPLRFVIVGDTEAAHQQLSYQQLIEQNHPPVTMAHTEDTELAFLLYTSGTTGHPKGVMLTEKNIMANLEGFLGIVEFGEERLVLALPMFHAYGLIIALAAIVKAGTLILVPKFHPRSILEAVIEEKATMLPLVPTFFTILLELIARQGGVSVPHLRLCISGGASLPAPLLQKIEATLNTTVIEGYGMTETSPVLTLNDPKTGSIPGCVGIPLPNVQVKIVSDEGAPCPVGETGEILVKGDNVMSGYYNLPEETQTVFAEDGWLKTGDLGHLDAEGHLFISGGRKKDLIIKAGENIAPQSIEAVLYSHPAIKEAAVIGIPDERLGEDILAIVSFKEEQSATPQDIIRFCREHLSASYIPSKVEVMAELPKNATGKIIKKVLKEQIAQRIQSK